VYVVFPVLAAPSKSRLNYRFFEGAMTLYYSSLFSMAWSWEAD